MVGRGVRDMAQAQSDVADVGDPDVSQQSGRRRTFLRRNRDRSAASPTLGGPRQVRRTRRFSIFRAVRRVWIPLVILAVVAAGGFTVSRLHGIFGNEKQLSYADTKIDNSKPYNPKHLRYEVFGAPGTVANISYFDVDGEPQHLKGARLPWSLEFPITAATAVGNVLAQGDSNRIGCRILVDGKVKTENTEQEVNAFTFCLLKAA